MIKTAGFTVLERIEKDESMKALWLCYQNKFDYDENYNWETVIGAIKDLYLKAI